MPRRTMNSTSRQNTSWVDDAPMPPALPSGYSQSFYRRQGQYPSTSYSEQMYSQHQYPRHIRMQPGLSAMTSSRSVMSPRSLMSPPSTTSYISTGSPRPDLYSGNFCLKREVISPKGEPIEEGEGVEVQRVGTVVHVIPDALIVPRKSVKSDGSWVECFFHEEPEAKKQAPRAKFTTSKDSFIIDGLLTADNFTDSSDRFCLGKTVIQTNLTKLVRQIGKGVMICRDEQKNMTLINLGRGSVYVACADFASRKGDPLDTVYKLPSARDEPDIQHRRMLLFDAVRFKTMLTSATTPAELEFLNPLCFTKISFLKGFGRNYPRRPEITECPFWVEIKLCEALSEADKILLTLRR